MKIVTITVFEDVGQVIMLTLAAPLLAGSSPALGSTLYMVLAMTLFIGLTIVFSVMFLATWAASSVLKANWWLYVAAAVCLLMGLHLLGVLHFKIPAPAGIQQQRSS